MPNVLLLQTNKAYARTLAAAVNDLDRDYQARAVSRESIPRRLRALADGADLIQVDECMTNGPMAAVASALTDTPLVVTFRGWADYTNAHGQYARLKAASIRARTRFVLGRADHTICLSGETQRQLAATYDLAPCSVVGRPIDCEQYAAGSADAPAIDLLTVTNLRYEGKYQGVKTTLEALAPVFQRRPGLSFAIAGGGAYLPDLLAYLEDYRYRENVLPMGYRADVPDLLARSRAFVYVSHLDAYPTTVLEAQAAGLPIVAGAASGVPAAVGDAGEIVPATAAGIEAGVERLLGDDAHRRALAERSERKMTDYNERMACGHVDVWNRVLGRDGGIESERTTAVTEL